MVLTAFAVALVLYPPAVWWKDRHGQSPSEPISEGLFCIRRRQLTSYRNMHECPDRRTLGASMWGSRTVNYPVRFCRLQT